MLPRWQEVSVVISGIEFQQKWCNESREMWLHRIERMIARALAGQFD